MIGTTHQGRDIIALKVTRNARKLKDGKRPAVLYNAMQHAREWLAGETCRRTLEYVIANYSANRPRHRLVDSRELWFVCVTNPDGYEYTFTPATGCGARTWPTTTMTACSASRRRRRPNRNFTAHWGLDNEGSSTTRSRDLPRPARTPSPRRRRLRLWDRVDFTFNKNDHTAAELLLWPQGFQQFTPDAGQRDLRGLAGNDDHSAIADGHYDPTTTGDHRQPLRPGHRRRAVHHQRRRPTTPTPTASSASRQRAPSRTSTASRASSSRTTRTPSRREFQRHKSSCSTSATRPTIRRPDVPSRQHGAELLPRPFDDSYGDPQQVQVMAKRSLGPVPALPDQRRRDEDVRRSVQRRRALRPGPGLYYHASAAWSRARAPATRSRCGSSAAASPPRASPTRPARNPPTVLSSRTRTTPARVPLPDRPGRTTHLLHRRAARPTASATTSTTSTADDNSPDPLGVLSHYKAVIWDKGDDYVTRQPGQPGQPAGPVAIENMIAMRDFLNEGGKLFFTGHTAAASTRGQPVPQLRLPGARRRPRRPRCRVQPRQPAAVDGCIATGQRLPAVLPGSVDLRGRRQRVDDENGNPLPSWATATVRARTVSSTAPIRRKTRCTRRRSWSRARCWCRRVPVVRRLSPRCHVAAPGRRPFSPFSGTTTWPPGPTAGVQAPRQGRPERRDPARSRSSSRPTSSRTGTTWSSRSTTSAATTGRRSRPTGVTDTDTGQSCPSGGRAARSAAPAAPALPDRQQRRHLLAHRHDRCVERVHRQLAGLAGLDGRPLAVRRQGHRGRDLGHHRLGHARPRRVGRRREDHGRRRHDARSDFEADTGDWQAGPSPDGTANPVVGWDRVTEQFTEGPVVVTTTPCTPGSASRASPEPPSAPSSCAACCGTWGSSAAGTNPSRDRAPRRAASGRPVVCLALVAR